MADYGEIGSFLGAEETAWEMSSPPSWAFVSAGSGLFFSDLSDRNPVFIDAILPHNIISAQMAPDIAEVIGAGLGNLKKHLLAPWSFDYVAHQRERDILPDTTGAIRGHVEADAERVPFIKVHLYYNPTGEKIASTTTNANGEYEFLGLAVGATEYSAMACLDDYNNAVETRMAAVAA